MKSETQYGYKLATFTVAKPFKPAEPFLMSNPTLGAGDMQELFMKLLQTIADADGTRNEKRSDYLKVNAVRSSNWGLVLDVSGGPYGAEYDVVSTLASEPGSVPRRVTRDDALALSLIHI